jgi:hypothetical protein
MLAHVEHQMRNWVDAADAVKVDVGHGAATL